MALRNNAEAIFSQSLADCSIGRAFARMVQTGEGGSSNRLLIDGAEAIDLDRIERIRIVAAGKASSAMLDAVLPHLQPAGRYDLAGVMIARERPASLPPNFQFFLGGHPLPDEASYAGARAALHLLHDLRDDANAETCASS